MATFGRGAIAAAALAALLPPQIVAAQAPETTGSTTQGAFDRRAEQLVELFAGKIAYADYFDPYFQTEVDRAQASWRRAVGAGVANGIPLPAMSAALAYFDGYRCGRLPANLLQAQRDYFGAHTYERVDKPRGQFFHTNWTGRGGTTASTTYNV